MMKKLMFLYGVACYALFFGAFLYAVGFMANLMVPKSIDTGAAILFLPALIIDLLLLGAFAIQHSVMARRSFKRVWTKVIPAPVERSTYVLFASLALILLFWQWRPLTGVIWQVTSPLGQGLLWALFGLGWGIVLTGTFMISHTHLFGLRQVYDHLRGREPSGPKFQTRGYYRFVRHPLMLGFLIAFWATPYMTLGHLVFAGAVTGYILIALRFEEHDLTQQFGNTYRAYKQRVPMLLPGIRIRRGATTLDYEALEQTKKKTAR